MEIGLKVGVVVDPVNPEVVVVCGVLEAVGEDVTAGRESVESRFVVVGVKPRE